MSTRLAIVAGTALAYYLLFLLNNAIFSGLGYSEAVNWIFLPSGLRLACVLIFTGWGAIGIAMASICISYQYQFNGDLTTIIGAGSISGFAPWLARLVCIDKIKLDVDLGNLTVPTLVKVSGVFAVLSPVLHQLWFTWRGQTDNFMASTAVMALGDFVGTLVMLYFAKMVISLLPTDALKMPTDN
jgi:hypothetical protein